MSRIKRPGSCSAPPSVLHAFKRMPPLTYPYGLEGRAVREVMTPGGMPISEPCVKLDREYNCNFRFLDTNALVLNAIKRRQYPSDRVLNLCG